MYTTSWGLHTTWSKLVETALVWKDVRPFRLARLRHATELEAGESHVNLASLPTEILNMIEDEIIKSARQRVSLQAPLFFDEDCCMESFVQWEPYWEALDLWAVLNDYDPGDQDSYNAAVSAFGGTQEAESLTDEYWQFHLESGQCLALARSSEFWPFLASGKYYWEADFDLEDQVCYTSSSAVFNLNRLTSASNCSCLMRMKSFRPSWQISISNFDGELTVREHSLRR